VQPRQWGGLELDLATFYEGMVLIASACASTGWVASVVGVHPWQIALFADEAQREVWEADADARASSSLASTGSVQRVNCGFHLSGRWHFSSGVDHCGWALLGAVVPDDCSGAEFRTFLVPRKDFAIDHESWQVTGLAGTGSKDIVITDAFTFPSTGPIPSSTFTMAGILASRSTIARIFACPGGWFLATPCPRSGQQLAHWMLLSSRTAPVFRHMAGRRWRRIPPYNGPWRAR
jgi:hypothetical protein